MKWETFCGNGHGNVYGSMSCNFIEIYNWEAWMNISSIIHILLEMPVATNPPDCSWNCPWRSLIAANMISDRIVRNFDRFAHSFYQLPSSDIYNIYIYIYLYIFIIWLHGFHGITRFYLFRSMQLNPEIPYFQSWESEWWGWGGGGGRISKNFSPPKNLNGVSTYWAFPFTYLVPGEFQKNVFGWQA